ncbi:hypothetical protein LUZ61_004339 [Rhynchospora tenuis]|uniref:MARVEL domain-containing protein n=1 Tax=Rhynchospora tenuis TaxID=198213 RepID=A0AAD5ZMY5_9POAL|nr:hypothetical protein LUZ61_004339 [Rhynchospora tenuis]
MSGLLPFFVAGLGFLFISAVESSLPISSASGSPSRSRYLPLRLRYTSFLTLSSLFLLSSLLATFNSLSSTHDPLGASLPLSSLAAASLFLLYSLSGLLSLPPVSLLPLPSSFLDLLAIFSFSLEFIYFYLRRKDLDGIENRYFDLLLVPILLCIVSTVLIISWPRSVAPRLARAAGLALQGTWFLQMGFSFFTNAIAHGCDIHHKSTANYTIKCKTHEEYHRARAIATLQFNCHLALLVVMATVVYGLVARNKVSTDNGYRPLNKELQMGTGISRFTLDSDEEDAEIVIESNGHESSEVALHVPDENGTVEKISRD